jgi:hypothetical protein
MSISFWLSFLFAAPPQNTCPTHGVPLLEMRERSETSKSVTATKLFQSGAWTITTDSKLTAAGCFDRKELRSLKTALQHAAWKTTTSPIACFAHDPHFTEYLFHGKLRFTEQMCSGKTADFDTLTAIDLVKKDLADALDPPAPAPAPPAPPPPAPPPVASAPACPAEGVPLFEVRHRSDFKESTSTVSIYSSGAWTFQPIDKDGHAGALTTGCFDKATTKTLHQLVEKSPWDVTLARITCKAYSPRSTDYYVHGQLEYTARLCGAQILDEKSRAALEIIEKELASVLPKQTSE